MRKINKKEFDCYFKNYKPVFERTVNLAVLSELKGKDKCKKMGYSAILDLVNTYWHLAQDFRPIKYYYTWLRKELSYIDDVFESLEKEYNGRDLQKVRSLHGKWLVNYVRPSLEDLEEEFRKGTSEYKFYKKMKQKGESVLKNLDEGGKENDKQYRRDT